MAFMNGPIVPAMEQVELGLNNSLVTAVGRLAFCSRASGKYSTANINCG